MSSRVFRLGPLECALERRSGRRWRRSSLRWTWRRFSFSPVRRINREDVISLRLRIRRRRRQSFEQVAHSERLSAPKTHRAADFRSASYLRDPRQRWNEIPSQVESWIASVSGGRMRVRFQLRKTRGWVGKSSVRILIVNLSTRPFSLKGQTRPRPGLSPCVERMRPLTAQNLRPSEPRS